MKIRVPAAVFAATAGLVGLSVPAHAGQFSAYQHNNFVGQIAGTTYAASYIDVPDNMTSSIQNYVGRDYSARNVVWAGGSEEVLYIWNGTEIPNVRPAANDKIDHFDARG